MKGEARGALHNVLLSRARGLEGLQQRGRNIEDSRAILRMDKWLLMVTILGASSLSHALAVYQTYCQQRM